jgi:hypothetical protein
MQNVARFGVYRLSSQQCGRSSERRNQKGDRYPKPSPDVAMGVIDVEFFVEDEISHQVWGIYGFIVCLRLNELMG